MTISVESTFIAPQSREDRLWPSRSSLRPTPQKVQSRRYTSTWVLAVSRFGLSIPLCALLKFIPMQVFVTSKDHNLWRTKHFFPDSRCLYPTFLTERRLELVQDWFRK